MARTLIEFGVPEFERYHEPFLGSGAAALKFAAAGRIRAAHLSDLNTRIINLFRSVQSKPDEVIAAIRLHALLDSDVHFATALRRMNGLIDPKDADPALAADLIYLLAKTFHSSWYEAMDGVISLSRRRTERSFKPRLQSVTAASQLLVNASIECVDFRDAWRQVQTSGLVFADPPYLAESDASDSRGYNANRFKQADFADLLSLVEDADAKGVCIILCWSTEKKSRLRGGRWLRIGRDAVWLSQSMVDHCGWSQRTDAS